MGKVALITGASRGIGRQMARDFAAQGYGVAIGYMQHEQEALALQAELGPSALAVHADIANANALLLWCKRFVGILVKSMCSSIMLASLLLGF